MQQAGQRSGLCWNCMAKSIASEYVEQRNAGYYMPALESRLTP